MGKKKGKAPREVAMRDAGGAKASPAVGRASGQSSAGPNASVSLRAMPNPAPIANANRNPTPTSNPTSTSNPTPTSTPTPTPTPTSNPTSTPNPTPNPTSTSTSTSNPTPNPTANATSTPISIPAAEGTPSEGDGREAPISSASLPLTALPADFLGAFFELCFPDDRLLSLCRELKLTTPGYRLEALPPDQIARVLADEYLEAKDARPHLDAAVREALEAPALESRAVSRGDLDEMIDFLVAGDPLQHLARIAWRALVANDERLHEMALEAIEAGTDLLEATATPKKTDRAVKAPGAKEAEEAVKRAERAERERAAAKEQLVQARSEIAQRDQRLAEERAELTQARAEIARLSAEVARLSAAGEGRALADARRYADEARALAEKLRASEAARDAAEARASALEQKLSQAPPAGGPAAAAPVEELPTAEEASTFLVPILTREFYDSLERWDRRMQRAAFDKIHRLANDWRHGSLRALALEGVPGYYRIRVATDVRLIYRRDGSRLEILSLIDREDLDRYIRQARTRPA